MTGMPFMSSVRRRLTSRLCHYVGARLKHEMAHCERELVGRIPQSKLGSVVDDAAAGELIGKLDEGRPIRADVMQDDVAAADRVDQIVMDFRELAAKTVHYGHHCRGLLGGNARLKRRECFLRGRGTCGKSLPGIYVFE